MILIVDNFDSFTFNLVDYFHQIGIKTTVVRNDVDPDSLDFKIYKGIVLSPGPETPKKAGFLLKYISTTFKTMPILGICLGHQAIGEFFGASVTKASIPMHGKIAAITHTGDAFFTGIPNTFSAVRYHSLIVDHLPQELLSIAHTDKKEIMAIRHTNFPIMGIQYHPESIMTEFGLAILKNWINLLNIELGE